MKILPLTVVFASLCATALLSNAATKERQQSMSSQEVLDKLMEGNALFQKGEGRQRDLLKEAAQTAEGQFPLAVVISCLDSRVPVEFVFDQGIGDLFVGRVAGNVVDKDMVGSAEFATKLAGARLVLVLGHDSCGAVHGAIAGAELGNLTQLLEKIEPATKKVQDFEGDKSASNPKYVDAVASANVLQVIRHLREMSPVLKQLEEAGDIMIVGGMYDLETGKVDLLKESDPEGHDH